MFTIKCPNRECGKDIEVDYKILWKKDSIGRTCKHCNTHLKINFYVAWNTQIIECNHTDTKYVEHNERDWYGHVVDSWYQEVCCKCGEVVRDRLKKKVRYTYE